MKSPPSPYLSETMIFIILIEFVNSYVIFHEKKP